MAFTQTQLDALEAAIATGSLEARFDGKEVRYRSLDEMMRIRDTMRSSLGLNIRGNSRTSLAAFTKDSTTPPPPNSGYFGQNNIG